MKFAEAIMRTLARVLVLSVYTALPASAMQWNVLISDGCQSAPWCFSPNPITIHAGDTIGFSMELFSFCEGVSDYEADCSKTGVYRYNVVADGGSFRCARVRRQRRRRNAGGLQSEVGIQPRPQYARARRVPR
jgi:hypothetical protein